MAGVLLIYTGGTIGSVRTWPDDPNSPLKPAETDELLKHMPELMGGSVQLEGVTIPVDLIAMDEFIDSSLITPDHWVEMATLVEKNYNKYDGFVILHGTDTMAYTASALSFMFDHLSKPVILTGSQRPISATRSDAYQNVITAIEIAAAKQLGIVVVPEVCIYFHETLLRGCRATKYDADGYTGFTSPNYPPLGAAGSKIEIYEELIRRTDNHALEVRKEFDEGVAVLELSPLMNSGLFRTVLQAEGLKGVVLEAYGAGNAPKGEFLDIIGEAYERGVGMVAVTQCYAGTVRLGQYDVSTGLLERGVISGMDMTPEAAQTKLSLLLADQSSLYPAEEMMQINLRGEMDESLFDLEFGPGEATPEGTVRSKGSFPAARYFDGTRIVRATLRLTGISTDAGEAEAVELRAHLNRKAGDATDPASGFAGSRNLPCVEGERGTSLYLDVTETVLHHLDPAKRTSVTITSLEGQPIRWANMHLAVFTE
ncbi:asparaginase [bacterium]|nr:asparaginase [bacterium]